MAGHYNPQQDGIHNIHARNVYHVVQQVAHAKPVAQHQPIFYGMSSTLNLSLLFWKFKTFYVNCLFIELHVKN